MKQLQAHAEARGGDIDPKSQWEEYIYKKICVHFLKNDCEKSDLLAWGISEVVTEEVVFGLHLERGRSLPGEVEWVRSDFSEGTTYTGNTEIQKKEYRSDYEVNQESKEIHLIVFRHPEYIWTVNSRIAH